MTERHDDDLAREIQAHLELEAEEQVASGLDAADARLAARRAFGSVAWTQEQVRAVGRWRPLDDLRQDARFAARTLVRNPGFACVAMLTLALGIGANTAVFSLVQTVLLRPLPFADPDRLVVLWEDFTGRGGPREVQASPANFLDWREQNRTFEGMAAIDGLLQTFNLTGAGEPERLSGARVTGNLFGVLGLQPVAGRTLVPDDDRAAAEPTAVISEGLWRRRFGADPALIGRTIRLNDILYTVVGVVPGHFQFPLRGTDVWVPAAFGPEQRSQRTAFVLNIVGRLKSGVTTEQAQADMDGVARRIAEQHPGTNARLGVLVVPLHAQYASPIRATLNILLAVVGVVLLVACVNVAHLLLARSSERRRELALRGALGAGRGRVFRQLLTESLLLASVGAVLGAAFSTLAFQSLARLIPRAVSRRHDAGVAPWRVGVHGTRRGGDERCVRRRSVARGFSAQPPRHVEGVGHQESHPP